ncbi:MAG: Do family serine endopeptidase [Alphaproteobacteria bacterium]|nr:Do family serine endopeptidase [Alphaproteobacteria bacterium]
MLYALRHTPAALIAAALAVTATVAMFEAPEALAQRVQSRGPQSVSPIAKVLIPAVVNVSTSQVSKGPKGVPLPDVPDGAPFEKFFDDFFDQDGSGIGRKVSSLGSGFVIDGKEGLIVTNNHVIADADEIYVNFFDGSKLKVEKIIGRDAKTDLALLKVAPKKPLAQVKFGSSETMEVGDWVMAIGNPFGLGGSVTVGIISAKERDINSGPYDDFLQTDAAINKGNSGGPLFNMDGDVIGVNTAIISPTGGSIGIGFAVPSDTALNVIAQLREYGETRRGWLGVRIQSISEDIASTLGVEENKGALVAAVEPDSPAAKSGIASGDVILKFDGKDVMTMRGLPRIVAQTPIGKKVPVEILRDGKTQSLDVEIGRLVEPEEGEEAKGPADSGNGGQPDEDRDGAPAGGAGIAGLGVAPISDELREKYNLGAKSEGLVVTLVEPDSPAAKKNVNEGDVIVEVAQDKVATTEEMLAAVDKVRRSGRKAVLLRIETANGDMRFVAVPLE